SGLSNGVTYEIKVTAVDTAGNESPGVAATGTPAAQGGGQPPGGGNGGNGGGGSAPVKPQPPPVANEQRYSLGGRV
ncbi:MAG: hypothetical protein H5T99_01415, partial [Moorella sp. (in: Bacteria)]|nr:hypothetical protein [Moorella sp. (in: firmicutes)]